MPTALRSLALILIGLADAVPLRAQHAMPPGTTHEQHRADMEKAAALKRNGDAAMGFDQDVVVHHFHVRPDGGRIELSAPDGLARTQARAHLREIAEAFAAGDFARPLQTHGELPPGAATLRRLGGLVAYVYAETDHGGAVQITTGHADALAAIHQFLRYQIAEHQTGDPLP